ncbi:dj-1 family protein [Moniliophthora roreri MCA 2997]|uniref:Dj-1 family protein n=2 Tax=Moniliophthora roreri TaxID=221103 RepID=V2WYA3_MONRO|nr:dj-1 family protein [Moniliophthora roreri MCA 2997]KAI3614530.1 dj-1 family protein [Moniliophthora roreri]
MSNTDLKVYRMAVCLYPEVSALDYQGPVELLCLFSTKTRKKLGAAFKNLPDFAIDAEFLSHSRDPVVPTEGPAIVPTMTYEEAMGTQFDIVFVPGGSQPDPRLIDPSCFEFIKRQGPGAKHVLTVCTGSWVLALTGLLNGKRATTDKYSYRTIVEDTKDLNITWVPKARWVVNDDKHIWTSSGVAAGMDLANAFLEYLAGSEVAEEARGVIELSVQKDPDVDEFAAYYGLV